MKVCQSGTYHLGKTKTFRVQGDIHKGVRNIYSVTLFPKGWSCECIDWLNKMPNDPNYQCKHIKKVIEYVSGLNDKESK